MKIIYYLIPSVLLASQCAGLGPLGIWCYHCVSSQPGCNSFTWFWHSAWTCPEKNDKCVKIIERKGAEEFVTRDCLSNLVSHRTDVPADRYEGCRPALKDVKLGNYVNNTFKELDIYREHYDSTTWCFCYFHNWCNSATSKVPSFILLCIPLLAALNWFT